MVVQKEQKIFTQFREKSSKFSVTVSNKIIIQKNFFSHTRELVSMDHWQKPFELSKVRRTQEMSM